MKRGFGFCASILFVFLITSGAAAETVLVEPFGLENLEVPVPCDVEEILANSMRDKGCDLVKPSSHQTPDIVITGSYWISDNNTYVAVRAADTVNSQVICARSVFLPVDEAKCRDVIIQISDEISDPPFYARKQNFLDLSTGMEFVFIPGGSYRMGIGDEKAGWTTVGPFFMARHEVTQAQWMKVMGTNPSVYADSPELPVENISWLDAMEFISRLNERTNNRYRLPTEAEWEFAARTKGRSHKWSGTNVEKNLDHFAWYLENAEGRTRPVGTKRANGLGIYDMSGNVWEWCSDKAASKGQKSGIGTASEIRVIRGGSWMTDKNAIRTFARDVSSQESRFHDNGLRLVLDFRPQQTAEITPSTGHAASN